MKGCIKRFRDKVLGLERTVAISYRAPTTTQLQLLLFLVGAGLLSAGLSNYAEAQHSITYDDDRLRQVLVALFTYIEGAFGAIVMVAAGIGAIMSSAFGQYRAALGLLVVALGAFTLRSFVHTFFNVHDLENAL